jgi:multiple sugar transport system ATP-binding protein
MGRAIVRDPKVFLFDEPLSNLDAKLRVKMRAEIKALHQLLKTTIVYVTHDQIQAMTMADKIVVLHGGRVEQIGSPLELYDRPRNIFVAGFLGSPAMNFLEGTLEGAGNPVLSLPGGSRVTLSRAPANSANRPLTLGIRPEDITFGGENGVDAVVKVVEPTGSETHVAVELEGRELTWVVRERVELVPEQPVKLSFETAKVHFFDRQTQQRLNA